MNFVKACVAATIALTALPNTGFAQTAPAAETKAPETKAPETKAPDAKKPDVADLLFGNPQWANAPVGSTITYVYSKKGDGAFGAPFDDKVVETLDKDDDDASRTVEVKMFSGANAKPAGPFHAAGQNPILLLVLEFNVEELAKIFKGNPRYMKTAIRKAWRENAMIESTRVDVDGKMVPGTRITTHPFLDNAEKDRMAGLDTLRYVIELADSVPGQITKIDISNPADAKAKFSEILTYKSEKAP